MIDKGCRGAYGKIERLDKKPQIAENQKAAWVFGNFKIVIGMIII